MFIEELWNAKDHYVYCHALYEGDDSIFAFITYPVFGDGLCLVLPGRPTVVVFLIPTPYDYPMKALKKDCHLDFYTGTGKGGQHRNRHYNCVRLRHIPTGIIVTSADQRSQAMNLKVAFERLDARLAAWFYKKPKRIPTKISKSVKRKILNNKKEVSDKKTLRKKVEW